MEKLIELLNESAVLDIIFENEYQVKFRATKIISKELGFIKWLVDNDKIDVESYCRITSVERKGEKDVYRDEVDSLLMLLAIQDKPIEFLCSILK